MKRFLSIFLATIAWHSAPLSAAASLPVDSSAYDIGLLEEAEEAQEVAPFSPRAYGPFRMVAPDRAELNGDIDTGALGAFKALLRDFPSLKQIDMIDCPGTDDDEENLAIARLIRARGITTHVPDGGSVRSGGVELFLAGVERKAGASAEFAVHSWRDEDGLQPDDYAEDDPANQRYLQFYRLVGMDDTKAKAFYALTNSVPADDALFLGRSDIARYVTLN